MNLSSTVHPPSFVNSIPFPPHFFMKTLTSSCQSSWTSSTHLLPLALYHMIWRLPSSNLCWKSHHLIKILWKTTIPFPTFHFCPKSFKRLFSALFSLISKKTTASTPFSQPIEQDTAPRPLCNVNNIRCALDNDSISVLLLLDLSAAFDTIDYQILLSHLNSVFGIQSAALQWFQSYLSDRYQSTSVNNLSSSPSQLMYDVPQGSVLGPILFALYTTPLSDIIANHSVNHQLFTDDTQLQKTRSSQWSDQPHQRTQCMHRQHKSMDDLKSAQTEQRQNRSSSLSLFVFLETFHSATLLEKLHWLPISEHIKYKVSCMCFSAINSSGPAYLSELLHVYTPSRTLWSSSATHIMKIQQYKRKTHGFHTFSCFGPHMTTRP